jgi:hypothetical protein
MNFIYKTLYKVKGASINKAPFDPKKVGYSFRSNKKNFPGGISLDPDFPSTPRTHHKSIAYQEWSRLHGFRLHG